MLEVRMHGIGGQGIVTGGEILSNAYLNTGRFMSVMPSYGVERRGSPVTAYGRISDRYIREKSMTYEPDILVIFDPSQLKRPETYKGFVHGGVIVACGLSPEDVLEMGVQPSRIVMVDGIQIAYEITDNNLTNMIMCGAYAKAVDDLPVDAVYEAIKADLPENFQRTSLLGAQRGYEEATVYNYDVPEIHSPHMPQWERKCLACAVPEKPEYEAPWGDCTDNYMIINTGAWRVVRPVVNEEACIKCGICATFCPVQCIKPNEAGYYHAGLGFCKGCGVCAHECPRKAITMERESHFAAKGGN